MIFRRTEKEIAKMQAAADVLVKTFQVVEKHIEPGRKTADIDKEIEQFIMSSGGVPAFKGYRGFPASACISIDEVVVHGIPGDRTLEDGQIVGVDIGVQLDGYYSDACRTFAVGEISEEKKRLMEVTEISLEKGIEQARAGNRISDISGAVQKYVEAAGFSVVRELVGHGIGTSLHEEPEIPNFVNEGRGSHPKIKSGMVFAIEPMVNTGKFFVKIMPDGWTVVTADNKPSAHFEHTIVVTEDGPMILTQGR